jgi:hypothetical protein
MMLRTTQKSTFYKMKYMFKHSFMKLGIVALLCMVSAIRVAAEDGVILTLKSGQKVNFMFSNKPSIAVSDAELIIATADGQKLSYDYAEVHNISFSTTASTDIKEITAKHDTEVTFKTNAGVLSVYNMPVGESVSIYTLSGQHIAMQKQTTEGTVLNIPVKVNGVLIVRTSTGICYRILIQ